MSENAKILSPDKEIIIYKWKVHEGSQISGGSVILLFKSDDSDIIHRFKNTNCGIVRKLLVKEGDHVPKCAPILEIDVCLHTTVINDLCADCGADLEQIDIVQASKASVPMIHTVPELKVSEALAKKIGRADTDRLLNDRKLVLLVDLDQTLIHTTNDNVPNNLKDVYHFQLYGPNSPWYHTRLRPGTLNFLKTIDPLYELHICTFGARNYAHTICCFLDQNGRLFSHRILSRDECLNATSKKDNLKALFPDDCGDAMVCIIDDREDVWNHATNLIQVKPYHFFQHTGDINAPPGLAKKELDGKGVDFNKIVKLQKANKQRKNSTGDGENSIGDGENSKSSEDSTSDLGKEEISDENNVFEKEKAPKISDKKEPENDKTSLVSDDDEPSKDAAENNLIEIQDPDDYLLYLETILRMIHKRFYELFDSTKEIPDLKELIPKLKSEILVGASIVFSGLVPNNLKLEKSRPFLIAKGLGAEVTECIHEKTTHLVAASTGTLKVTQAQKNRKIKIVTPDWLWTCAERWEHVNELLFPLSTNRMQKNRQVPAHCSPERIPEKEEIKFSDTINPYLAFSNDEIRSMTAEVEEDETSSSSSSSDEREPTDMENPPLDKSLRKRKRAEEADSLSIFKKTCNETFDLSGAGDVDESDSNVSGKSSNDQGEEEMPSSKFRKGEQDIDSENSVDSADQQEESDNDGDWNTMGAELEREFLGFDD